MDHFSRIVRWIRANTVVPGMAVAAALVIAMGTAAAIDIGDPLPEFPLGRQLDGDPVELTAGDGKTVYLIEFWRNKCYPSSSVVPTLNDIHARYADRDLKILAFSTVKESESEAFVKEFEPVYPNFQDTEKKNAYFTFIKSGERIGVPLSFIIDKDGTVIWRGNPRDHIEQMVDKILAGGLSVEKAKELYELRAAMADALCKGSVDAIITTHEAVLAAEPDNPTAYATRCKLISRKKIDADFVETLRRWRANCPDTPAGLTTFMREVIENGGEEAVRHGIEAGEKAMAMAAVVHPDTVEYLADCYDLAGEYEKAEALRN